ncbi:MAG TPA: gamma-glutamyl-gamma-aminobutyrate hydrolase family protein [Gemmatimonadales bacterium]|jgi:putative glutamine amidotransferase
MASRPIIGVPTQTLEEIPDQLPRCWVMSQQYVRVLVAAGAIPWIIPLIQGDPATLRDIYDRLDGIFLPGGVDLDPTAYQEVPNDLCGHTDPARDEIELTLTRWALEDKKPLLAVCRGIQVLNVAAGGTVHQDLATQLPGAIKHDYFPRRGQYTRDLLVHNVTLAKGSRLASLLDAPSVEVNSMHHQGIKDLASALRPTAYAPDGLIEGLESPNGHFLLGVQWHPEALVERDPRMNRLFAAFIDAAR